LLPARISRARNAAKLLWGISGTYAFQIGMLAQDRRTSFAGRCCATTFAQGSEAKIHDEPFLVLGQSRNMKNRRRAGGKATRPSIVEGALWGGNPGNGAPHCLGTPYFEGRRWDYVSRRRDTQIRSDERMWGCKGCMKAAGALEGGVLGRITQLLRNEYDMVTESSARCLPICGSCSPVPCWTGLPFGHTRDKATLAGRSREPQLRHRKSALQIAIRNRLVLPFPLTPVPIRNFANSRSA